MEDEEIKDIVGNPIYDKTTTFKELGVCEEIIDTCQKLGFKYPSKI